MPATLEIDQLQETPKTVATRLVIPPAFLTGLSSFTVSTLLETPIHLKEFPQLINLNVGAAFQELYRIEDNSTDIEWVTGLGEPHWTHAIPAGYGITEEVPRKKKQEAIRLLDEWMRTPDELGSQWWAEFENRIKHTKFGKLP